MAKKRYTPPDTLLQTVISDLERGTPKGNREGVRALLVRGPLIFPEAIADELVHQPATDDALARLSGEMLAFLRGLVQAEGRVSGTEITVQQPVTFAGRLADGDVTCLAAGRDMHDLAVQQLIVLIHTVGLHGIRLCAAPDCPGPRLFVKTYRREYCSVRCQKRTQTRELRRKERDKAAILAARQQRQRKAQRRG